ncbi:hypothetical protein CVIRNUC_005539 [Coccomyxa viridis]|uniref:Uncharacterized protein n=1 Tax=Coccomyxa viridis TaxID=1274662 RepID=A0AAV1I8G8_9CHLO|nr:hypothetical protein CVIRNUC_005539 [Coccomyxa viridis]
MHLPRLAVRVREYEAVPIGDSRSGTGKDVEDLCCRISESTLSCLEWLAARIGPGTSTLSIRFWPLEGAARHGKEAGLMQAFQGHAHLTQLKCLEIVEQTLSYRGSAVIALFLDWLLKRMPGLCALNLAARSWRVGGGNISLDHLQHLQISADSLEGSQLQAGLQLPLLQTLCINGGGVDKLAKVDVAGCHQLKQVALKDVTVETLHRQPSCQLDIDKGCLDDDLHALLMGTMGQHMGAGDSVYFSVDADVPLPDSAQGLLGTLPALQMLKVFFAHFSENDEDDFTSEYGKGDPKDNEAQPLLMSLMPSVGSVCNLKVIIVWGRDMRCTIPAGLPNLEELVIWMNNSLDLFFEDPGETSKALTRFYAYAEILVMRVNDMQQMSKHFGTAGLALSAVVAPVGGIEQELKGCCMFLKPASAADPPMEEVRATARRLVHACRCGACFDCLRTAGRVD